jgi:hypothetical protein
MRVAVIGVLRTLTGFNVHLFLDVGVPLSLGKLKKERDALLDRVNVELRKHNDKPDIPQVATTDRVIQSYYP